MTTASGGPIWESNTSRTKVPPEAQPQDRSCHRNGRFSTLYRMAHIESTPATVMLLSPRERECPRWIADRKTAWETSVVLGLSVSTVRSNRKRARRKLGATLNTQAVGKAIKDDLFSSTQ